MSSSLEVRTRAEGTVGVVELLGDVSVEGESQILQAYESETAEGRRDILIELSRAWISTRPGSRCSSSWPWRPRRRTSTSW